MPDNEPGGSCSIEGCPHHGDWRPLAHFYNERGRRLPGTLVFKSLVCGFHKETLTPETWVNVETWPKLATTLGCFHQKPIREKTQIFFEPA